MNPFVETLIQYWPVIIGSLAGLLSGVCLYLAKRIQYKKALVEKELENLELQKSIIEGSYIICPGCGTKIMLKSAKIYTGGTTNE